MGWFYRESSIVAGAIKLASIIWASPLKRDIVLSCSVRDDWVVSSYIPLQCQKSGMGGFGEQRLLLGRHRHNLPHCLTMLCPRRLQSAERPIQFGIAVLQWFKNSWVKASAVCVLHHIILPQRRKHIVNLLCRSVVALNCLIAWLRSYCSLWRKRTVVDWIIPAQTCLTVTNVGPKSAQFFYIFWKRWAMCGRPGLSQYQGGHDTSCQTLKPGYGNNGRPEEEEGEEMRRLSEVQQPSIYDSPPACLLPTGVERKLYST